MRLTKVLPSSSDNIFVLVCPSLLSFSPFNYRGQMQACDFRHTQIKSLSPGKVRNVLNSHLFSSGCVCLCVCVCVITLFSLFSEAADVGGREVLKPISLLCFCSDWLASLSQNVHDWLLINFRTLADTHMYNLHIQKKNKPQNKTHTTHTFVSTQDRGCFFFTFP